MVVIGDKGMIVFADVLEMKKLMFYDHDVRWEGASPIITKAKGKGFHLILKKNHLTMNVKLLLIGLQLIKNLLLI